LTNRVSRLTLPPSEKLGQVAIICHRHADADTFLSAYALSFIIRKLAPEAKVALIIPEGMSTLTQRLSLSFPYEQPPDSPDYDLLIAVDIGHTELLKDWNERLRTSKGLKVLIDHHPVQPETPYDQMLVDTSASSAAEIVYSLFEELKVELDSPQVAQALLVAILFDSQNLSIGSAKTLRAVLGLIEHGARLDEARASLRSPPDYGEVIAKLKAARRSKIFRAAGWVIMISQVGSFQANVARSFVHLGADVAIVLGDSSDGETRASMRANQRFHSTTKIHLGTDVAEVISKARGGYGGGHPTAASFTCAATLEEVVADFLGLLGSLLKEKAVEIK
jgi:nanoRNase/pAp phosphatase (c-di-AMP/oligoRNAs hydrolase)